MARISIFYSLIIIKIYYNILFIIIKLLRFVTLNHDLSTYIGTERKINKYINPVPTNTRILLTSTEVTMFKMTSTKTAALNLEHI